MNLSKKSKFQKATEEEKSNFNEKLRQLAEQKDERQHPICESSKKYATTPPTHSTSAQTATEAPSRH